MKSTRQEITESIFDTEIFLERRRRIHLMDIFFYTLNGLEPIIVYVAQAETPEPDGTYRHGYAFYSVLDGEVVGNGSLLQRLLFTQMPRLSRVADIDEDFPDDPALHAEMDALLEAIVRQEGLTKDQLARYEAYLRRMRALRPASLHGLYDFFLAHIPEEKAFLAK